MKRKRNINSVWHRIEEFYSSGFPVRMVAKSRPLGRDALAPIPIPPSPDPEVHFFVYQRFKTKRINSIVLF